MDKVGVREELANAVRAVLLRDWDPIRVQEFPEALRLANSDEYDGYVEPLVAMIVDGREKPAIEAYLLEVETRRMGVKVENSRAAKAADMLFCLESEFGR